MRGFQNARRPLPKRDRLGPLRNRIHINDLIISDFGDDCNRFCSATAPTNKIWIVAAFSASSCRPVFIHVSDELLFPYSHPLAALFRMFQIVLLYSVLGPPSNHLPCNNALSFMLRGLSRRWKGRTSIPGVRVRCTHRYAKRL